MSKKTLQEIFWKLYLTTPEAWLLTVKKRIRARRADASSRPRMPKFLDALYYARRDPLIQKLLVRIQEGDALQDVLLGFPAKKYDERVLEYPYFLSWLLARKELAENLLDVGCVLNNKLVNQVLQQNVTSLWFSNPAIEPLALSFPVNYHVAALRQAFPGGAQFSLVTSLSTIEHIGYDNSQYGIDVSTQYDQPSEHPYLQALTLLAEFTAPGGSLLVSVPFGFREIMVHPVTRKKALQVFDYASIKVGATLLSDIGFAVRLEVFQAYDNGWHLVDPSKSNVKYADGCPAACAVAFLVADKEK